MICKKERLLTGNKLTARATELGVSTTNDTTVRSVIPEAELQRRVIEAERAIRENKLWIIALFSALASFVSAIASWIAVLRN